jgi:hypothetical protein
MPSLSLLGAYALATALYAHGVVARAPAGARRLALALPLLAASLLVPLYALDYHDDTLLIIPVVGVCSLTAFKARRALAAA